MKTFTAGKNEAGQRFDKYLGKLLANAPKSFIYKMLRKKNITLNGGKATGAEKLNQGDKIDLYLSDETFGKFSAVSEPDKQIPADTSGQHDRETAGMMESVRAFSRNILYEDEDLLFWNKPQGVLSQPDHSGKPSVAEMLRDYLLGSGKITETELRTFRPAPVNRLDRNTSGIVLCGKSLKGLQFLSETVRERDIQKTYICIISGNLREGRYEAWLRKDDRKNLVTVTDHPAPGSRKIITAFRIQSACGRFHLAEADLITGRPHQIRAHLRHLGCCILGDPKYGNSAVNRSVREKYGIKHQMLHAESITFPALSGDFAYLSDKTFQTDMPDSFRQFMRKCSSERRF